MKKWVKFIKIGGESGINDVTRITQITDIMYKPLVKVVLLSAISFSFFFFHFKIL